MTVYQAKVTYGIEFRSSAIQEIIDSYNHEMDLDVDAVHIRQFYDSPHPPYRVNHASFARWLVEAIAEHGLPWTPPYGWYKITSSASANIKVD